MLATDGRTTIASFNYDRVEDLNSYRGLRTTEIGFTKGDARPGRTTLLEHTDVRLTNLFRIDGIFLLL